MNNNRSAAEEYGRRIADQLVRTLARNNHRDIVAIQQKVLEISRLNALGGERIFRDILHNLNLM